MIQPISELLQAFANAYDGGEARFESCTNLEVDGNVSIENGIRMRGAGANIFVLGTAALFRGDLEANIHAFRDEVFGG